MTLLYVLSSVNLSPIQLRVTTATTRTQNNPMTSPKKNSLMLCLCIIAILSPYL